MKKKDNGFSWSVLGGVLGILSFLIIFILLVGTPAETSSWKLLTARWGSSAGEVDEVRIDASTNSLQTVDYSHHAIHAGSSYVVKDVADLGASQVVDARVITPDTTEWIHIFAEFDTETEYEYYIVENVDITTSGVTFTPRNRNRNFNSGSPDQSSVFFNIIVNNDTDLAKADTDLSSGITIYAGSTGSTKKVGGGTRAQNEFVLKRNTTYMFRLVCVSAGWADYKINLYEHTDKN